MFTLKSERAIKFYSDNPHIDFNTVNIIFIELLEKFVKNMSNTLNDTKTLDILKELSDKMTKIENNTQEDRHIIQNMKSTIDSSISNQKDTIISSFRDIIKNNENENTKFIDNLISRNHDLLEQKITNNFKNLPKDLENVILSKNELCQELENTHLSLKKEIEPLLLEKNDKCIENLINNKYNELSNSITTNIQSIMSSHMNTQIVTNNSIIDKLKSMDKVEEYFEGQNNSNKKGKQGENRLEPILMNILSNANIINTSGIEESGDFIIERVDKSPILIDTKDYKTTVPKDEVDKIIRDIDKKKCNGILISQNSGIALKNDYEINIHNNFIIVFLHNVEYDENKISIAINIIDSLFPIVQQQANMEYESISCEQLNLNNKEFQSIISQKKKIIKTLQENTHNIINDISKIDIPTLSSILNTKFSQSDKLTYKCNICNDFIGKNSRALAAHKRGCIKKNNNNDQLIN